MRENLIVGIMLISAAFQSSCVHRTSSTIYESVSVDELVTRADSYDGKRVRVAGFLIALSGGTLIRPTWQKCYGEAEGKHFVTTDLAFTSFGPLTQDGVRRANEGRLVIVEGMFIDSSRPWTEGDNVDPPDSLAAGPIRNARIVQVGNERCDTSLENSEDRR